jgi:Metal-dependent hydrolases of the beta-lactamase superfamily I
MDIRFWGTRGSLAKPGRTTLRHGGNTSCVEVRGDDGTLIVLDCGTGAHGLGQALLSAGPRCDGHLLITHTHWDHIQGFPFFAPLFVPGNTWDIYAPGALGRQLEQTLAGQMEYNYFPSRWRSWQRRFAFTISPRENSRLVKCASPRNISITRLSRWAIACSPVAMWLCTRRITSRMPRNPAARAEGEPPRHKEDQRHIDFLADADLVIHDSQYTIAEYPQKTGWGHTPAEWAVDYAVAARQATGSNPP